MRQNPPVGGIIPLGVLDEENDIGILRFRYHLMYAEPIHSRGFAQESKRHPLAVGGGQEDAHTCNGDVPERITGCRLGRTLS